MVGSRPVAADISPRIRSIFGERADLVARHADGAGVVVQRPGDALADPPRRVGAELELQPLLVLVHRPHQAAVAFLDQVGERQPAVAVVLGDATPPAAGSPRPVRGGPRW